jgi:hypothetical protein
MITLLRASSSHQAICKPTESVGESLSDLEVYFRLSPLLPSFQTCSRSFLDQDPNAVLWCLALLLFGRPKRDGNRNLGLADIVY